jgi:hypothetical protein
MRYIPKYLQTAAAENVAVLQLWVECSSVGPKNAWSVNKKNWFKLCPVRSYPAAIHITSTTRFMEKIWRPSTSLGTILLAQG